MLGGPGRQFQTPERQVPGNPWRSEWGIVGGLTVAALALASLAYLATTWLALRSMRMVSEDDWDALDSIVDLLDVLPFVSALLFIGSALFFVIWLGLVWTSDRSDPAQHQFSHGLAVGGWFIPIAGYVVGGRALLQLWRGVKAARDRDVGASTERSAVPWSIVLWWIGWIVTAMAGGAWRAAMVRMDAAIEPEVILDAFDDLLTSLVWMSGSTAVTGVLLMIVVLQIMGMTKR